MIIQNESDTIDMFLKKEKPGELLVSTTVHDHRLSAGGHLSLNNGTDGKSAIQERWTIVAASGTPRASFFETEDINR